MNKSMTMHARNILAFGLLLLVSIASQSSWSQAASPASAESSAKTTKVPDLVDHTFTTAKERLLRANLELGTVREETSHTVSPDHVISQQPDAGDSVKIGSKVDLVIAKPTYVKVPDVIGLKLAEAEKVFRKTRLEVGEIYAKPSVTVPAGRVISEHPQANDEVTLYSMISLTISSGAPTISVPNVVGTTQAAATSAITGAGLIVGTVTSQASSTVAAGLVISEAPGAGTGVAAGSAVNLIVSTGAAMIAVPNVVGATQAAAASAITGAGLVVGTVTTQASSTVASGLVISETPAAGTSVASGSAVNLVISTGTAKIAVPNVVGATQAAATSAITGAGLIVGTVTSQASSTVASGLVISETPAAGTSVASGSAVNLVISSGSASAVETEHALTQTGLAIGLASTVLQTQIEVLVDLIDPSTTCNSLPGGGSVLNGPGANQVSVYYDSACSQTYVLATAKLITSTVTGGTSYAISETAAYQSPGGTSLGSLTLNETAFLPSSSTALTQVYGLGLFTPASGAKVPVQLGLYCGIPLGSNAASLMLPCAGGIAQDFPSLGIAIGAVTPLNLTLTQSADGSQYSVGFVGGGTAVAGPLGSLTLTNPSPTSLVINGGTDFETTTASGSAATFALFPPTPTLWNVVDAAHDETFAISVTSNTTRNLAMSITQTSTGAVIANGSLDQSGTGTMAFSDGTIVAVTNWTLGDEALKAD